MTSPDVVIAQNDPGISRALANDLHAHFARVTVAENDTEVRTLLMRHKARLAVLDLELVDLEVVSQLAHKFGDVTIVCTHRSPDEQTWLKALNAGAAELCHPLDLASIVRASRAAAIKQQHMARAA